MILGDGKIVRVVRSPVKVRVVAMPGSPGLPGIEFVDHDADPNVARPAGVPIVIWRGTVFPLNSTDEDFWKRP